jgi:tetratricopeptide (TPR) repeat protein
MVTVISSAIAGHAWAQHHLKQMFPKKRKEKEGDYLVRLGTKLEEEGDYESAIITLNHAFSNCVISSEESRRKGHKSLAFCYRHTHQAGLSNNHFSMFLEFDNDDIDEILTIKANMGINYHNLEKYQDAINIYKQVKADAEKHGKDGEVIAGIYNNIGISYREWDYPKEALKWFSRALEMWIKLEKKFDSVSKSADLEHATIKWQIAKAYQNMGNAFLELNEFDNAAISYYQALDIYEELYSAYKRETTGSVVIEFARSIVIVSMSLAGLYTKLNFAQSLFYFDKAQEKVHQFKDLEIILLEEIGDAYLTRKHPARAMANYRKALKKANAIKNFDEVSKILYKMGIAVETDNPEKAYEYYKDSINKLELSGIHLNREYKTIAYGSASDIYQRLTLLCLQMGKKGEAFELVEKSKSQGFLDELAETKIRPTVTLTPKFENLLQKEEIYQHQLRQLRFRRMRDPFRVENANEIDQILQKLFAVYEEMLPIDKEYVSLRKREANNDVNEILGML